MKDFIEKYIKLHAEGLKNLPYSINVIDELHASENAHSRILNKLLQYQLDGHYVFFESFVENILGLDLAGLDIGQPVFTSEKERIDVLIVEKYKFAIIIENKIHGAVDQKGQLDRYIDKVQTQKKIDIDKIYLVYLTRDGEKEISDDSLSKRNRQKFAERIFLRNYREHILNWLKELQVPDSEEQLHSALKQYTDHLDNLFELNPNMKEMNIKIINELVKEYKDFSLVELENRIKELHSLNDSLPKCIERLEEELNDKKGDAIENVYNRAKEKLEEDIKVLPFDPPFFDNKKGFHIYSDKVCKSKKAQLYIVCEYDSETEDLKIGVGCNKRVTHQKTKNYLMKQVWFKEFKEEKGVIDGTNGWYAYYSLNIPLSNEQLLIDTIVENMVYDYKLCKRKK